MGIINFKAMSIQASKRLLVSVKQLCLTCGVSETLLYTCRTCKATR